MKNRSSSEKEPLCRSSDDGLRREVGITVHKGTATNDGPGKGLGSQRKLLRRRPHKGVGMGERSTLGDFDGSRQGVGIPAENRATDAELA